MILKKYLKEAFKQSISITFLLGIIPLLFALGNDLWKLLHNNINSFNHLNKMIEGLIPLNQELISVFMYLSILYFLPLFIVFIVEKELGMKLHIPRWIKTIILHFEYPLITIFSLMFVGSSIFFTVGLLFLFANSSISNGLVMMSIGIFIFSLTTFSLAIMLELKEAFLEN